MKNIKIKLVNLCLLSLSFIGVNNLAYANNESIGKTLSELIAMQRAGDTFANMKSGASCTFYYNDSGNQKKMFARIISTVKAKPDIYLRVENTDSLNGIWETKKWKTVNAPEPRPEFIEKRHVAVPGYLHPSMLIAPNVLSINYAADSILRKVVLLPSGFYVTSEINAPNPYYVPGC